MNKINVTNFNKLIAFLRELPSYKFRFDTVVSEWKTAPNQAACGTVCCAVGWFPAIFDRVEWRGPGAGQFDLSFKYCTATSYYCVASRVLKISKACARDLFTPDDQTKAHPELPLCGTEATPDEVADMLGRFIELVRGGEIEEHCIEVGR